jgi:hypothetical protein
MNTLLKVTLFAFVIGLAILCCSAPWTTTPAGSDATHNSLGYAAIWSHEFAAVPGARVDLGAFAMLAGRGGVFRDCDWRVVVLFPEQARGGTRRRLS